MYISENIKYLRLNKGLSQEELSRELGYKSYTTITKWESGISEPTLKKTNEIADFFKISVNELCYTRLDRRENITTSTRGVKIPVLGKVAAGIPIEAVEDIVDYEEITEAMARKGEYFGLKIQGDSMEPRFKSGDVVIVRKQNDAETGDIVIATVNGADAVCKRLQKYSEGIALISSNPVYEPYRFTPEDISNKPVRILGKVVELRAKF